MAEQISPTKNNLFKTKKMLKVAKEGYSLLDKKRNVLMRELMTMIGRAEKTQQDFFSIYENAHHTLKKTFISLGSNTLEKLALAGNEEVNIKVLQKSVMGVSIPKIDGLTETMKPKYSFIETNPLLDESIKKFKSAVSISVKMAEIETAVVRLSQEIKKTQKRANALENILIPRYEGIVKFIVESLEEKEREEFFKVKLVKKHKTQSN